MPIFISYSHQDKEFVDKLAVQLVSKNVSVWLDRWELSVGDSLLDRVQEAVDGASALLVILSKASTASAWCRTELSAGLLRELEEKRVVVMPVLLEDCDIPIFARGKMYADFRSDFDAGLKAVLEGVAKVTNPSMSRVKETAYHTDWSVDWVLGKTKNVVEVTLTFIQAAQDQGHSILTTIEIQGNAAAAQAFQKHMDSSDGVTGAKLRIVELLSKQLNADGRHKAVLEDEHKWSKSVRLAGPSSEEYSALIETRRLGDDNGRNILVHIDCLVSDVFRHMSDVLRVPKSSPR